MRRSLCVAGVFLALACTAASAAEYRMYLKLPGADGPVTVGGESGWIELTSVRVGPVDDATGRVSSPVISVSPGEYRGPDLASVRLPDGMGIEVSKEVDAISPKLSGFYENRRRLPSAKLCFVTTQGEVTDSRYLFKDAIITAHVTSGDRERMTITYATVQR